MPFYLVDPSYQSFFALPDGQTVGVTRFKITSTNINVPLAPPAFNPEGAAGAQLSDVNDSVVTSHFYVRADGTYRLNNQSAALVGKEVTLVSFHPNSNAGGT